MLPPSSARNRQLSVPACVPPTRLQPWRHNAHRMVVVVVVVVAAVAAAAVAGAHSINGGRRPAGKASGCSQLAGHTEPGVIGEL